MNNSSKLGEEVYLTKEDLTEMKLQGKMEWTIYISGGEHPISVLGMPPVMSEIVTEMAEIVTVIYNTTNLLRETPETDINSNYLKFFTTAGKKITAPIITINISWNWGNACWSMMPYERYGVYDEQQ